MKYFKRAEFIMGQENVFDKMDKTFLERLDDLRESYGLPITVTSSYRSQEYNKSIGGSKRSKHLDGIAVDIACRSSKNRAKLVYKALEMGFTVGITSTFVHLDTRNNQIMFTYG